MLQSVLVLYEVNSPAISTSIGRKQGCVNASIKHKMASKTAVFFLLLAFWGILDIKAASVTSYKKDTWVDRLAGLVSSYIFQILSLYYHGWCTRISLTLKSSFHVLL